MGGVEQTRSSTATSQVSRPDSNDERQFPQLSVTPHSVNMGPQHYEAADTHEHDCHAESEIVRVKTKVRARKKKLKARKLGIPREEEPQHCDVASVDNELNATSELNVCASASTERCDAETVEDELLKSQDFTEPQTAASSNENCSENRTEVDLQPSSNTLPPEQDLMLFDSPKCDEREVMCEENEQQPQCESEAQALTGCSATR